MKLDSFLRAVKKIIADGCICYTVITLLLFSSEEMKLHLTLPFALLFAAMNYIVLNAKLPSVLKLILHYAVTTAILFVLFIVWGGLQLRPSTILIMLACYTVIYAILAVILFAVHRKRASTKNNKTQYTSQFSKKK